MNSQHLYNKAAQLLDRATGENEILRGFYEDLARSYCRIASEIDRRSGENIKTEHLITQNNEMLARLLQVLTDKN